MTNYFYKTKNLLILLSMILLFSFLLVSCKDDSRKNYDREDFTPIPGPPPMPMIFEGNFTVCKSKILFFCLSYEPGPENIDIFGEIVHGGSLIAKTLPGKYMHVILSPVSIDDEQKSEVNFYLGKKDGDNVKANESWKFSEKFSSPTTIYLDLSFDRLPKKEK
tara:strand:+ start:2360 stop:2848 length:489 start_codon:yes stop_codon:yes gene_type:complete